MKSLKPQTNPPTNHSHLNEVVATVLLVLQLEVVEGELDVVACWRLDDPVAVLLVVVVDVPELGVREEAGGGGGGSEVTTADRHVLRHEPLHNKFLNHKMLSWTDFRLFGRKTLPGRK